MGIKPARLVNRFSKTWLRSDLPSAFVLAMALLLLHTSKVPCFSVGFRHSINQNLPDSEGLEQHNLVFRSNFLPHLQDPG